MKYTTILVVFLLCQTSSGWTQNNHITRPEPPPSIAIVPADKTEQAIEVSQFHVNTKIHGNLATTTLDLSFYNPNHRNVAADFLFPVPNNGMITGYALEVNGVMVDGVAVEKNHARVTFDKIVRQGIDPGLVEKVAGNVFKTRIFPLFAQQSRRIQISYVAVLSNAEQGYSFTLPLMADQLVKDFSLKIDVMNAAAAPIVQQGQFKNLSFNQWQNAYVAEMKKPQIELDHALHLSVPKLTENMVLVANNHLDQFHFAINPKLETFVPPFRLAGIDHIQLVWDASHSRLNSNHQLALKLLDTFFKQHRNLQVDLYLLRNELQSAGQFTINKGQWSALKTTLSNIQYDGGTNLSSLNQLSQHTKHKHKHNNSQVFMFTDGLHTFDRRQTITTPANLHIFSTDLNQNQAFNRFLAQKNGGNAYQLEPNTSLQSVVSQILLATPQLTAIEVLSGTVSGLPKLPKNIDMTRSEPITGMLKSPQARLRLHYSYYGKSQQKIDVDMNQKQAFESNLLALIGAQQQLEFLQHDSKGNQTAIINLSQEYGLVSDHTSLVVLENLEQYVEHKIAPPKTLPTMRQQYFAQLKSQQLKRVQQTEDKINQVITMWEKRKAWWQRDFPLTTHQPKAKLDDRLRTEGERQSPPPPMMSLAEPAADQDEQQGRITVTGSRIRGAAVANETEEKDGFGKAQGPSVQISAWNPDTPYLKALSAATTSQRQALYYDLKQQHLNSPAFYFDCANYFLANQQLKFGTQVLSNIAELKIQDSRLLRTMAMKLKQYQLLDLSIETYRKVLADRPEEPQSHRDLALALTMRAALNNGSDARQDYQQALALFNQVITQRWDRFHGIEVTTLMELNRLLPKLSKLNIDTTMVDPRLIALLDVDVRITLNWDSDLTDIDLWVIEPTGEKVTYSHMLSGVGGMFHQDFTGGYGPEEYLIKRAPSGVYTIKVHFYGNNSPELTGATTLYVNVFTNYGRSNEAKQTLSLRLDEASDDYLVGSITF